MKITNEERKILEGLPTSGLRFLSKIAEDKDFESLKKIIEGLVDYEKNRTFSLIENDKLLLEHAYARGRVAGYIETLKLIMGSRAEIERREEERQKQVEKRKEAKNG